MRDSSDNAGDAELATFTCLVCVGAAALTLTSVGAISAAVAIALGWFFGRPLLLASILGATGVAGTILASSTGPYSAIVVHLWQQYQAVPLSRIPHVWLWEAQKAPEWLFLAPLGLILGAFLILLKEDLSSLRQPSGDPSRSRATPAPWTRILIKRRLRAKLLPGEPFVLGVNALDAGKVTLTPDELGKHTVIVGRSGMGKTTTEFSMWQYAILNGIPLLVIQGKHEKEDALELKAMAEAHGRPTYFFDVVEPNESTFYDLLANKSPTEKADCIKAIRNQYSDEHYDFINTNQLQTTFTVLKRLGLPHDFHQLPDLLSSNTLRALLRRSGIRGLEYQTLAKSIERLKDNEKAGIASLRASIANLTESNFGHIFNLSIAREKQRPILDLLSARRQKAVVYFGLSTLLMRDTSKRLAALIINDLKTVLPRMNSPYMIAADECGALFDGPQIINIINQGRSYGAMCILGTQSWADFELPDHPQFVRQLAGSCNTFITHEITDPDDAELAAGIIGTIPSIQYTNQMLGSAWTGASSARLVREFRVHPDDLKCLRRGEAYLLSKDRKVAVPKVVVRKARV